MSLEIIGFIATIFSVVFAVYVYYKRKYPGRITCFRGQSIPLLYTVVDRFKDVKITYLNEPIDSQLNILNYFIVNTGWRDISKEMVKHPIIVKFPPNHSILDIRLDASNELVMPSVLSKSKNEFQLDFNSLLINESIKIELLVNDHSFGKEDIQIKRKKSYNHEIEFTHRILNTSKIQVEPIPNINSVSSSKERNQNILMIFLAVIMFIGSFFIPSNRIANEKPYRVKYLINHTETDSFYVNMLFSNDNFIQLVNDSKQYYHSVRLDSFFTNIDTRKLKIGYEPKIVKDLQPLKFLIIIIGLAMFFGASNDLYNRYKYRKIFQHLFKE